MPVNHRLRRLILVLSSITLLALFAVVQAERGASLAAYLPAVFGVVAGPPVTPGTPPPVTVTPTATATPDPSHFNECAFRTGNNATIALTADVTVNGAFTFAVDDEIAIFNPDGSVCAGTTNWDGKNIAITAWGDDSQTEAVDGLLGGEEMKFRIWDKSAGKELMVSTVTYSVGTGIYQTDSVHVVSSLTVGGS